MLYLNNDNYYSWIIINQSLIVVVPAHVVALAVTDAALKA
tara:strand:+ start:174 stop:293 length:120 start_codon:yes stop_codon:yes gene_type:complete